MNATGASQANIEDEDARDGAAEHPLEPACGESPFGLSPGGRAGGVGADASTATPASDAATSH